MRHNAIRIPEERWEELKGVILGMYLDRKTTLTEVRERMEKEHGFSATYVSVWRPSLSHSGI